MKQLVWKLIEFRPWRSLLINLLAAVHSYSYLLLTRLAITPDGQHPKHKIIRYQDWFLGKLLPEDRVLDVGSHEGTLVRAMAGVVATVTGIEISETYFRRSTSQVIPKNVHFLQGDATVFDFSAHGPFTVVTLSNVLEHIRDRIDFLSKLRRNALAPGNRLLIRVPTIERDWLPVYKKSIGVEWRLDKTHFVEHTVAELEAELIAAGFKPIDRTLRFGEIFVECVA